MIFHRSTSFAKGYRWSRVMTENRSLQKKHVRTCIDGAHDQSFVRFRLRSYLGIHPEEMHRIFFQCLEDLP